MPNLNNLYLSEFNGSNQNPICKESDYRSKVFKVCIWLRSLDGVWKGFSPLEFDYADENSEKPSFKQSNLTWYTT